MKFWKLLDGVLAGLFESAMDRLSQYREAPAYVPPPPKGIMNVEDLLEDQEEHVVETPWGNLYILVDEDGIIMVSGDSGVAPRFSGVGEA